MKKLAILGLLPLFAVGVAVAVPAPKVFVCKYVGTPGVDERLQTGQNPISVSLNAIPDGTGVGDSFADQHGRSLVIAFDEGQELEPECPVPENPPSEDNPPVTPPATPPSTPTPTVPEQPLVTEGK